MRSKLDSKEYVLKMMSKNEVQTKQHAQQMVREKDILMEISKAENYCPFIVRSISSF